MQWRFFNLSLNADADAQEDFNRFLRGVKVLCVHREFVQNGDRSCWALAVEYMPQAGGKSVAAPDAQKNRVDYRELLGAADFDLFVSLRSWRKELAQKEGVPVYTVFTNDQLAEISRLRCDSKAALQKINGIGRGRIEKYGAAVLEAMRQVGVPHDAEPETEGGES